MAWSANFGSGDAEVLRLYRAFFGREPDLEGAEYWMSVSDDGHTLDEIAQWFSDGPEFAAVYTGSSNAQYVARVYRNILNRPYDDEGYNYWLGKLNSGELSRAGVVRWFAANPEFRSNHPYPDFDDLNSIMSDSGTWGSSWSLNDREFIDEVSSSPLYFSGCGAPADEGFKPVAERSTRFSNSNGGFLGEFIFVFEDLATAIQAQAALAYHFQYCTGANLTFFNNMSSPLGFVSKNGAAGFSSSAASHRVGKVIFYSATSSSTDSIDPYDLLNGPNSMYARLVSQGKYNLFK